MNEIDKKLFEYLGDKTLSFGCKIRHHYLGVGQVGTVIEKRSDWVVLLEGYTVEDYDIIGHEPTLTDFHKWLNEKLDSQVGWTMNEKALIIPNVLGWEDGKNLKFIIYKSSLPLMQQSDTTKEAILKLILGEYGNNHTD